MSRSELTILRADKDDKNSCVVIETEQGQDWVSCAECTVGEMECDYLRSRWSVDPCLFRRGVRLGRGLKPDPRDIVSIVSNNIPIYLNMMERNDPLLKAEKDMVEKVLGIEKERLEQAKGMLFSR
jgi:hypothetical protein